MQNDYLEIIERLKFIRDRSLDVSERHTCRSMRERAAGAADCCARLLAEFGSDPNEEIESEVDACLSL